MCFAAQTSGAEPAKLSGLAFVSQQTRALQADDTGNPGMLWVLEGEQLWSARTGTAAKACADCHGAAPQSMRGVAARYPAFDASERRLLNLEARIDQCRTLRQGAPAFTPESRELLALASFVAHQSRGLPIAPPRDPRLAPFLASGARLFRQRRGQLDLSCHDCHDQRAGQKLAGNLIPQAHPTGYPLYRLEWQAVGSLQRRLRGCMTGVRARAFDYGSPELIDLELFLMSRAAPLPMETPAVRP
ncbi:MAG: sulfur oxidation c-type cytochrome SoxA [Steroidobacteraceae bacterium]